MSWVFIKLSEVLEMPAFMDVILDIDEYSMLLVYWRCEETCLTDSIALEGVEWEKSASFSATQFLFYFDSLFIIHVQ